MNREELKQYDGREGGRPMLPSAAGFTMSVTAPCGLMETIMKLTRQVRT